MKSGKITRIAYFGATGLVVLLFVGSGIMYLLNPEMIKENMIHLGYPTYLTFILPFTKIGGALLILQKKFKLLKEWAYAGLFINSVLAMIAHGMAGDGWINAGSIGSVFVLVSYFLPFIKLHSENLSSKSKRQNADYKHGSRYP